MRMFQRMVSGVLTTALLFGIVSWGIPTRVQAQKPENTHALTEPASYEVEAFEVDVEPIPETDQAEPKAADSVVISLPEVTKPTVTAEMISYKEAAQAAEVHSVPGTVAPPAAVEPICRESDYQYTVDQNRNCATITKYTGSDPSIRIPDVLGGYPVTVLGVYSFRYSDITNVIIPNSVCEIDIGAFQRCASLAEIDIPDSVTQLGNPQGPYKDGIFEQCINLKRVKLPSHINIVPNEMFYDCHSLTNVQIPEGVTEIGEGAFLDCFNLSEVYLPKTLTEIQGAAFGHCKKLQEVEIPDNVTSMSAGVFTSCSGLTDLRLPNSLVEIEDRAFQDCSGLTEIQFPDTLQTIGYSAFARCTGVTELLLPNALVYLGQGAFQGCSGVTKVKLPAALNVLEKDVFAGCTNLREVKLGQNIRTIGFQAFLNCTSLPQIQLPASLTDIAQAAFSGCESLSQITFPEGLKSIGYQAFYGCSNLAYASLPDGLTEIRGYAFACSGLKQISIPANVTSIGDRAFYGCPSLSQIQLPEGLSSLGSGAFLQCTSLTEIKIPDSITVLPYNVFFECSQLSHVILPEGLTKIGGDAFRKCTSLKQICLPESLNELDYGAFSECKNLSDIQLPSGMSQIHDAVFRNCISLKHIELPKALTLLGESSFEGCTSLQNIRIPEGITVLNEHIFDGCSSLEYIVLPESLTEIQWNAFTSCTALTRILPYDYDPQHPGKWDAQLPEAVTYVGAESFEGCTSLKNIYLPDHIETIHQDTFAMCSSLEKLHLPDKLKTIEPYAFYGCGSLKELHFPELLQKISHGVFRDCVSLEKVRIPGSVTQLSGYVFSGCSNLKKVELPASITYIDHYPFERCINLETVILPAIKCNIEVSTYPAFPKNSNLTIYGALPSDVAEYALKNDIHFVPITRPEKDYSTSLLDMERTSFYTTFNHAVLDSHIPVTLRYAFREDTVSSIQNAMLEIQLSESLLLEKNYVYVNGKIGNFTYRDNRLVIPVSDTSGIIQFYAEPVKNGYASLWAMMSCQKDGAAYAEIIDLMNLNVPVLTMDTPKTVCDSFHISGITDPSQVIDFFVNEAPAGSTSSKKDGTYSAGIELPSGLVDGDIVIIKAVLHGNPEAGTSKQVIFTKSMPTLTEFSMGHNGSNLKIDLLHSYGTITSAINPRYPFHFKIVFDNYKKIGDVFVIGTKNNEEYRMKAVPGENPGEYTAEGFFKDTSGSYLPESMRVVYTLKTTKADLLEPMDKNQLPNIWRDATVSVESQTDTDYQASIHVDGEEDIPVSVHSGITAQELRNAYVPNVQPETSPVSIEQVFKEIQEAHGSDFTYTLQEIPESPGKKEGMGILYDSRTNSYDYILIDQETQNVSTASIENLPDHALAACSQCVLKMHYPNATIYNPKVSDAIEMASDTVEVVGRLKNIVVRLDKLEQALMDNAFSNSMTIEEVMLAYHDVRNLRLQFAALGIMQLGEIIAAQGTESLFGKFLSSIVEWVLNREIDALMKLSGGFLLELEAQVNAPARMKWLIDPSGYVYDTKTQKRLPGVAATIYCILSDNPDETFWAEKPSDTEYGTVWDAEEYSQERTLITDEAGCYAWDVPEGWWRVHYTKEGYQSAWSDWLPVPPPQLEVNIGLTPIETNAPENPFSDVKENMYYYEPILWAVENEITTGTSDTTFSPERKCTRAEIVTFLWRFCGCPEPVSSDNPFSDVKAKDWFYKPVLWAAENGITVGFPGGVFKPMETCNRAQVVTFLHRMMNCPKPTSQDNPFTDVGRKFYTQAVMWAVENGITTGTSDTTFSPDASCTRGQVITFLYRMSVSIRSY